LQAREFYALSPLSSLSNSGEDTRPTFHLAVNQGLSLNFGGSRQITEVRQTTINSAGRERCPERE
jgi:hypothetical protein